MAAAPTGTLVLKLLVLVPFVVAAFMAERHSDAWLDRAAAKVAEARAFEAAADKPPAEAARIMAPLRLDRAGIRSTLLSNPLDIHALSELVEDRLAAGDRKAADHALALLGTATRRSPSYLKGELSRAAEARDLARFVVALDRLAILAPKARQEVLPYLVGALTQPGGPEMIAAREGRPWYAAMIGLGARAGETRPMVASYLLQHRPAAAEQREALLVAMAKGYLAANDVAGAQAFLADFGKVPLAALRDFGWAEPPAYARELPLFWQYPNAQTELVRNKSGKWQLSVTGPPDPQPLAQRVFVVDPDAVYQIAAEVDAADAADIHLYWKVGCGRVRLRQITSTDRLPGTGKAVTRVVFEANPQCSAYRVSLVGDQDAGSSADFSVNILSPALTRIQ